MRTTNGAPVINFALLTVMLPIVWPLAKARDAWVLHGHKVVNGAHNAIDKIANKLYDLC